MPEKGDMPLKILWILLTSIALMIGTRHAFAQQQLIEDGGYSVFIGPTPAWIGKRQHVSPPDSLSREEPISIVALDMQFKLSDSTERYERRVLIPNSPPGLSQVAQFEISFDPSYETATLHQVTITRDGEEFNALNQSRIRLLRREQQLENNIQDGLVSAVIPVDDVRLGDLISYEYSISGVNPDLAQRFSTVVPLAFGASVAETRIRIVDNKKRSLKWRANGATLAPGTQETKAYKEWIWELDKQAPIPYEDNIPMWAEPVPYLEVSEYGSWQEVSDWAARLYSDTELPPDLQDRITEWKALDPREAARQALRFVQSEIRYYAVTLGVGAYRPRPASTVLSSRYGDCKDKTMLLTAILRALDVVAEPALVSSSVGVAISNHLPSVHMFDHIIVRAEIEGEEYWLDPTITEALDAPLSPSPLVAFGYALPTRSGAELTALPPPQSSEIRFSQNYIIDHYKKPIRLDFTVDYSGRFAQALELILDSGGQNGLAHAHLSTFQKLYPELEVLSPMDFERQSANNVVRVRTSYNLHEALDYKNTRLKLKLFAEPIMELMSGPEIAIRRYPYALPFPARGHGTINIELPEEEEIAFAGEQPVEDENLFFKRRLDRQGKTLSLAYDIQLKRDHVPASQAARYSETTRRAQNLAFLEIRLPAAPLAKLKEIAESIKTASEQLQRANTGPEVADGYKALDTALLTEVNALLKADRVTSNHKAAVFAEQSDLLARLGRHRESLKASQKALQLDPGSKKALASHAEVLLYLNRPDDALATLDRTPEGGSRDGEFWQQRARIQFHLENWPETTRNLDRAYEVISYESRPYSVIWQQLAALHTSGDPSSILEARNIDLEAWPGPIARYLGGQYSATELIEAAKNARPAEREPQLCEAYYFLGAAAVANGQLHDAKRYFESVIETDIKRYIEYEYARLQLDSLNRRTD